MSKEDFGCEDEVVNGTNALKISTTTIFDSLDISEGTKQEYISRLPHFINWLSSNGLNRDTLLNYKQYLSSRSDLGVASKNKYLAVARIALKELHRRGKIPNDITHNIKSFQQSQKHRVEGLNGQEVQKLCVYLQELPSDFRSHRLRAMIALLLFQGLRQIEICRLNISDIDLVSKRVYVLGKGRDDKEPIHLHPQTTKALKKYLSVYKVKDGSLFAPINKLPSNNTLTTRGLRMIIREVFEELAIDKTVHGLRHYFTTALIKQYSENLTQVMRYTRHRNYDTVQIYNDDILDKKSLVRYYSMFENASIIES